MKIPKLSSAQPFKVQPFYHLSELSRMTGISPPRLSRMLERHQIKTVRDGRLLLIPLSEINEKLHWLRESLEMRDIYTESLKGSIPKR